MAREKIGRETVVSTTELAIVLGLTARRVQQLASDGVFPAESRGKYNLSACVSAYIQYAIGKKSMTQMTDYEARRKKAEAQLKEAKAGIADLEWKELQGQMHRAEDVEEITDDLIYAIRGALLALPGRVAMDAAQADTAAKAAQVVRREVFIVMQELSEHEYDPAKYREKVRERAEWRALEEDDGDDGEG